MFVHYTLARFRFTELSKLLGEEIAIRQGQEGESGGTTPSERHDGCTMAR